MGEKRDEVAASIFANWRERRDRGDVEDPEDVMAAHPQHATELRRHFETISALEQAYIIELTKSRNKNRRPRRPRPPPG